MVISMNKITNVRIATRNDLLLETESATHMAYLAETIPESRKAEYTILPPKSGKAYCR